MRHRTVLLRLGAVIVFTAFWTRAIIVPTFDLDALCAEAALIVVGQVASLEELGKTTIEFGDRTIPAREMVAELHVDHVLKGTTQEGSFLRFHFTIPDEFIGWRSVGQQAYRVFFLKKSASGLMLSSPYYPSLVAVPGTDIEEGSPTERVIAELAAVLESQKAPLQDKREAVYALDASKQPEALRALKRSAEVNDMGLRLTVSASLLEHNDISTLPFAEHMLLNTNSAAAPDLLHNLSYAIHEGIKDARAVPTLTRLLGAGNVETRRAAASALVHIGSSSCIDPLLSAIGDSDYEVRYYSVVGLAEITGQADWRPNMDDFNSDQNKYLSHWRDWRVAHPK